jgi:apolipoprotein N-acyltransferase
LNCSPLGDPTSPGTEIKVTPESAVPIIPKATKYHLEFLLAVKKTSLPLSFLLTLYEM